MENLLIVTYLIFAIFYSIKRVEELDDVLEKIFVIIFTVSFFPILLPIELANAVNKISKL